MELKDLIKNRRVAIGKTLEQVGKEVGVTKTTVLRWESGEIVDMRRDKISALAVSLETTPAYIMGWEDGEGNLDVGLIEHDTRLSPDEVDLIAKYKQLNGVGKAYVRDMLDMVVATDKYIK